MEHTRIEPAASDDAESTAVPVEVPSGSDGRHDGWTRQKQATFLRNLSATHCVSAAASSVGMGRQSAYKLRARLKGEPFDIAWQAAFRLQYDGLFQAAIERAIHGVEVPHFHYGELIHTSRRFDERATVALLALGGQIAAKPRCWGAEREQIDVADFDLLVARVEHGEDRWDPVDFDTDEDDPDE